jgi:hypothetical protein
MVPPTYSGPTVLSGERHEEWLLDDAIDDTFPASDAVALGQPGSSVNLRYAALERHTRRRRSRGPRTRIGWLLLCGLAAGAWLLVLRTRHRPNLLH